MGHGDLAAEDIVFQKSDGSSVWIKAETKLPYLTFTGTVESQDDFVSICQRLQKAFQPVQGLAAGQAFLIREQTSIGSILFCAAGDKRCAVLWFGPLQSRGCAERPCDIVRQFFAFIESAIADIARQADVSVRINAIEMQIALCAG
jgi:hypothetical protein